MEENPSDMFIRRTLFQKLTTTLPVVLLVVGGIAVKAEEPSKKEGATKKTEPVQEEKGFLDFRAYRPGNSIFKNSDGPSSSSIRLPQPSAPSSSRQDREFLDRQKNWIFLSPKDANKTDSPEEMLGVDSLTLEKESSKSVLTKFLENKPADRVPSGMSANGLDRSGRPNLLQQSTVVPQEQTSTRPGSFNQPGLDTLFSGNPSAEPTLSQRFQTLNNRPTEKLREERRAQMAEFESLFSPPNTTVASGTFGTLNTANNFGLQKETATTGGNLERFRLPQVPKVGDGLRTQIPGAIPGSSVTTPGGINARTFGPSALPAPTVEPPRNVSQPVNLQVPKRRF